MIQINIEKLLYGTNGKMTLSVSLEIKEGEFVVLSGKSGSGKSTFLRIVAGLEDADAEISVGDKLWNSSAYKLSPQKREIGFVFQEYALFENMSVLDNLLFVNKDKELAFKLLEMTEMIELQNRKPKSLSGGQKQRVSLCRAMMKRPKILLMDEPLSALDPNMRQKLQEEILALHKEFKMTTVMVTHDSSEIYKMATRVLVLENARIVQDGTPREVLLQTQGSQKFTLYAEILDIKKADIIYVAVVSIGQQIVEVVLSKSEAEKFKVGERVLVSTKAFAPSLSKAI